MTQRGVYDWWSRNPWALRCLYGFVFVGREGTFRRRSIAALDLDTGDSVLELGCGPGNSFDALREAVGPDGTVVGVEYSRGMVRQAADRIRARGWENVHVVQTDATRPGIAANSFDAVYAAMSLSAMSDPARVVRTAAACLTPDGRITALDARPFQRVPVSLLNPVLAPVFGRLTDWKPGVDIPAAIGSAFETTSVRGSHLGSIYIASGARPRVTQPTVDVE
jgi:demethylmenaquinone methyltransferase/2-methoxy-6-polyprenyl-1,4-benzoquinol methylase